MIEFVGCCCWNSELIIYYNLASVSPRKLLFVFDISILGKLG